MKSLFLASFSRRDRDAKVNAPSNRVVPKSKAAASSQARLGAFRSKIQN